MVSLAVCILALGIRLPPAADLDGHLHHLLSEAAGRPVALVFIAHDCPVCNSYAPELTRLATRYKGRALFEIVYAEPSLSLADAKQHAHDFSLPTADLLMDPKGRLSSACGA